MLEHLDWCGLSLDSAASHTQKAMGRRIEDPVRYATEFGRIVRSAGVIPKLNTVVTSQNVSEDVSGIVRAITPVRWKIFQYLPMEDERLDGRLSITSGEFQGFVERHRNICPTGVMEWEDNERMVGSYVMIDPRGRFFDTRKGDDGNFRRTYSDPILDHGVSETLSKLNYDVAGLIGRGGVYPWRKIGSAD